MRAVAQRVVWILSLLFIALAALGLWAWSPITILLAGSAWTLANSARKTLSIQGDIYAPTPHVQYWGRALLFRAVGLMSFGAIIAGICFWQKWDVRLSSGHEFLLLIMLMASVIVTSRLLMPGFFAASWDVHGAPERRRRERSSTVISRWIVRAVAAMVLVSSTVSSYSLLRALELRQGRFATLKRIVDVDRPLQLDEIAKIISQGA